MRLSRRIRAVIAAAARRAASKKRSKVDQRSEYLRAYCAARYVATAWSSR